MAIMEYQKKCKARQIRTEEIQQTQYELKCLIASLENVSIINPYATLIELPSDIAHPRKSLLLLLDFIEVITYFFQHQREQITDTDTGEIFIQTQPEDIELAFKLLKKSLFRRADELSTTTRGFYKWLNSYLTEAKTNQFTALDIRKAKAIHPRTLNRYLQELKLYSYIKVVGGNKHREGYRYQLTDFGNQTEVQSRIEQEIQATLKNVWNAYRKEQNQEPIKQEPSEEPKAGADFTYRFICSKIGVESGQTFTVKDVVEWTNANRRTIKSHLKKLTENGKLERTVLSGRQYIYTIHRASKTVSQNEVSNSQTKQ